MNDPYVIKLDITQLVQLILTLSERQARLAGQDESFDATCADIRAQLQDQGALDDMARWYGLLTDETREAS